MSANPNEQAKLATVPPPTVADAGAPQMAAPGSAGAPDAAPETDLWAGRTSWRHYVGRITLWFIGNAVIGVAVGITTARAQWLGWVGAVWTILGVVVVSALIVFTGVVLRVLGNRYRVTTQRLFIERGILSKTVDQTELIRVDDVRLYQSFFDRLFKVGTITVLTTDATDRRVTIEGIFDPTPVAEAIRQRMRVLRGKSLYVETL